MFNPDTINELYTLVDTDILQLIIGCRILLSSTKIKEKDLKPDSTTFGKRVAKRLANSQGISTEYAKAILESVIEIDENEAIISFQGLGGSQAKTIKDILQENNILTML